MALALALRAGLSQACAESSAEVERLKDDGGGGEVACFNTDLTYATPYDPTWAWCGRSKLSRR